MRLFQPYWLKELLARDILLRDKGYDMPDIVTYPTVSISWRKGENVVGMSNPPGISDSTISSDKRYKRVQQLTKMIIHQRS